jgi:hypothetical protein
MNPIKYLNTFDEVRALVSKVQKRRIPGIMGLEPFRQEYYRGQISDTFVLKPSLARYFSHDTTLLKVEQLLIEDFKQEMSSKDKIDKVLLHDNPHHFQNEWSWLGQAQHYRLPTRMLDWTLKWEVALYFAVEDVPAFNSHNAQFWVFYVPDDILMHDDKKDLYYQADPLKLDKTWFVNPSFFWTENQANETAETRRARQHGKFSIQAHPNSLTPLEEQAELIPHLEKYCIPADAKGQMRLELASQGIFGEFLYANEDDVINGIISSLRAKYSLT